MSRSRRRVANPPARTARWMALLALALAGSCAPRAEPPAAPAEPAAAPQPAPAAAGSGPCVEDLGSTLSRFDSPPALERRLRSASGPLPLVTYGPLAEAEEGDEHRRQAIRFLVPQGGESSVYLQIFDVDTGWKSQPDERRPWDDQAEDAWDAVTRFRLVGRRDGEPLLEHLAGAGRDTPGDQRWTSWGPIPLACAAEDDAGSVLVLEVEGVEGNDGNVFLAGLSTRPRDHVPPAGLRMTSTAPTVRLLEPDRSIAELRFAVPETARRLTVRSFDLARGGLRLETSVRLRSLRASGQGEAVDVTEEIDGDERGRAAALLFQGGFDNPNDVTFSITDQEGAPLAIELPGRRRAETVNRPPQARLRQAVADDCRTVTFDGSASSDPDGDPLRFHWEFGDGGTAVEARAEHVYAEPGAYRGRLLVEDDSGAIRHAGRRPFERRIWARPVAEAGADRVGAPGVALELDGSASVDPDGGELSYAWSFGDGAGARGESVSHRWRRPGTFEVTLAVEDDGEAPCNRDTDSLSVMINGAPRAEAGPARLSVAPGEEIAFDGGKSSDPEGQPLAYRWDFGDDRDAEGVAVGHRYQRPGTYRAVLTVTDPSGAPNASDSDSVEVFVNAPPRPVVAADLPACGGGGAAGVCFESCALAVAVDAAGSSDADGDRLTYLWSFGDGAEAGGRRAEHLYADDGDYAARLTVDDGRGLANSRQTAEVRIRVHRPPRAAAGPPVRAVAAGAPLLLSGAGSQTFGDLALRYLWEIDPGDAGATSAGGGGWEPTVVHRFLEPGTEHRVRLTVVDESGFAHCRTGAAEVRVRVGAAP